jgi:two-component system KDP operon response regulator KdpE
VSDTFDIPEPMATILVIEDEPQLRRFLRTSLPRHGYHVLEAETAAEGLAIAERDRPDAVLLDLGLPDGDGVDVTRKLRTWMQAPIIVISARGREQDKIDALDAGAEDYVTKPFGLGELMARIRVALRHMARPSPESTPDVTVVGDLTFDRSKRVLLRRGVEVHLTKTQFKLLDHMLRNEGKILTHRQILKDVWGPAHASQTHYLRVFMAQLRQKIEDEPARPRHLLTETGIGYRFKA